MKWLRVSTLYIAALAAVSLALVASAACAFPLRSPQVGFSSTQLQNYLNVVDPGINATTDQLDAQTWSVTNTGTPTFTLRLENAQGTNAPSGVYNGNAPVGPTPPLYQVFPGGAVAGWYATLSFAGGNLTVSRYNQFSVFQGSTLYLGVNAFQFGFYMDAPLQPIWYSQDNRNFAGPRAQMLTYESPSNPGSFWNCWEARPSSGLSTFDGLVIKVEAIVPTPVDAITWGAVKARYH
jgi:hypothetical protein